MQDPSRHSRNFWRPQCKLAIAASALFTLGLIPGARADSTDVLDVYVTKGQLYQQTSPANPVARTNPFTFKTAALASRPNSITSARFFVPGASSFQSMTGDGLGNFAFDGGRFASLTALNMAFPNGTYNFQLQTVTVPTAFAPSVTLTGDSYPITVPKITNTAWASGALQVDATQNFTFTWSPFAGFSMTDSEIILQIADASNNIVFAQSFIYPNNPTSLTMPKGTLQPGQYYTAGLIFQNRQLTSNGKTLLHAVYLL